MGLRRSQSQSGPKPASCGSRREAPASLDVNMSIVNGRAASECAWPWQIRLPEPGCGGTLIAPDWVLSAGHCNYPAPEIAWAGLHNSSQTAGAQSRRIVERHRHPSYHQPEWYSNDLLLLRLESPFELSECVNTACLPEAEVPTGTQCWISGWGALSEGGSFPEILQEVAVDVKSQWDCEDSYGEDSFTSDMMCANGRNSGGIADACQGDSGGPFVCESDGQWFVQGATSWGKGCANSASPGVYSRTAYNREWIRSVMSQAN